MPSRFAMQIGEKLMEGEVVNRSKAQRVYREILHQARDPALLEQSQARGASAEHNFTSEYNNRRSDHTCTAIRSPHMSAF